MKQVKSISTLKICTKSNQNYFYNTDKWLIDWYNRRCKDIISQRVLVTFQIHYVYATFWTPNFVLIFDWICTLKLWSNNYLFEDFSAGRPNPSLNEALNKPQSRKQCGTFESWNSTCTCVWLCLSFQPQNNVNDLIQSDQWFHIAKILHFQQY